MFELEIESRVIELNYSLVTDLYWKRLPGRVLHRRMIDLSSTPFRINFGSVHV